MQWRRLLAGQFAQARRALFAASGRATDIAGPPGYEFALFAMPDFEKSEIVKMRDRATQFPLRLGEGHRCYGWRGQDGQIASYLWFSDSSAANPPWTLGVAVKMRSDAAYIWDCRTAPGHEGRGLYTAGLVRLRNQAAAQGARLLIDCAPDNTPSVRAIERAGFARIADAEVRKIGPLNLVRINSGRWRAVSGPLDPHSLGA